MTTSASARILVVDDDPLWRRVLCRRLVDAGFAVEWAPSGSAALTGLAQAAALPDLVLTDLRMPGGDGYTLTAAIRDDPRLAHLPIVVMTSLDEQGAPGADPFLGIRRTLIKPVPIRDIVAAIAAALATDSP